MKKRTILALCVALFTIVSICTTVLAVQTDSEGNEIKQCVILTQSPNGTDMEEYYTYVENNDGPMTCTIIAYTGEFYSNIIPESLEGHTVTRIGDRAFKNINKITGGLTIPPAVISIGNEAFSGCTLITGITLSSNTKTIGNKAFEGCSSLMKINLNNVEHIGSEAFKGCSGLKGIESFTFTNNIKSIGSKAFEGCAISQIEFTSPTAPQVNNDTFAGYEGKVIIPQQDSEYMGQAWVGAYVKGVNKIGDLDGNGVVDANDASLVLERYKNENATRREIQTADIDRNGLLDANDASLILEIYKTNA